MVNNYNQCMVMDDPNSESILPGVLIFHDQKVVRVKESSLTSVSLLVCGEGSC